MNSRILFLKAMISGVPVRTTWPSSAGVAQAGAKSLRPSTSTRQIRQPPNGSSPG